MSGQATGWVLRHGPKDRAMRAVLITIADAANRDGEHAHPGLAAMIEGSLYGRAHVLATVAKLVEAGWVEIEEQGVGRGHATVYRVCMDRPQKVQPVDVSDEEEESTPEQTVSDGKGPISDEKRSNPGREKVQSGTSSPISSTVNLNGKPLRAEIVPLAARMGEGCRSLATLAHEVRFPLLAEGRQLDDIIAAVNERRDPPLRRDQAVKARDIARKALEVGTDPRIIVAGLATTSAFTFPAFDFAVGQLRRDAKSHLSKFQRSEIRP